MPDTVITRFAPSPTGYLHIGGARTALFNWLFARANGGQMRLRIEDTDRERSTEDAVQAILDGLTWLGLTWDDDVVHQFARADRHREIAEALLADGKAYRCYATPEELAEMRETATREKRPPRYDGRWRDRDPSEAPAGAPYVIRLRAPQDGETTVDDKVQGLVRFPNKDLDDFVLLRSDGTPTYMLSVVVDDHDMDVTHIIRGDDHLTNGARQTLIYHALGWDVPVMAHIPLIHGPDGAKLSKRHGALGVDAYRAMGYLPDAMRNYLARLGWAHGDDEIFTTEQAVSWFGFDGMGKSAARFDFAKLENLNGHYIRAAEDADLVAAIADLAPDLENRGALPDPLSDADKTRLREAMPGLKERAKTILQLIDSAAYLFVSRPLDMDAKSADLLTDEARQRLGRLAATLGALPDWEADALDAAVRTFCEAEDVKLGKVAQPMRAALTGRTTSPGIFDVMVSLGREESLARLNDQAA